MLLENVERCRSLGSIGLDLRLAIDAAKSMPFPGRPQQASAFFVAERAVREPGELLGAREGDLRPGDRRRGRRGKGRRLSLRSSPVGDDMMAAEGLVQMKGVASLFQPAM